MTCKLTYKSAAIVGFIIQFAGSVPVFLEFNNPNAENFLPRACITVSKHGNPFGIF